MQEVWTRRLSLSLLGVPVTVLADDRELGERLAVCYARSGAEEGENALTARLERAGTGWRIAVDGREPVRKDDAAEAVRALNHELMHGVMLRNRRLYYVHAAVVEHGGRGILLPGLSQAGKSTLALAFLAAGARFLSDELLAYDASSGRALAFPRAVKIRDACVDYFPAWKDAFLGAGEGRFLPFDALGGEIAPHAAVHAIVLPRWSGPYGATELVPASPGQALLELAASSLNFGTHRVQSLDFLSDLVAGARAFRLAWREPHGAVARVLGELEAGT